MYMNNVVLQAMANKQSQFGHQVCQGLESSEFYWVSNDWIGQIAGSFLLNLTIAVYTRNNLDLYILPLKSKVDVDHSSNVP